MSKGRSFGITIRTAVGITERMQSEFEKWLKGQDYGSYVTEKCNAEKHIHAQVWLKESRTMGNLRRPLVKMIIRNYDKSDYIMKVALCTKFAWSDGFGGNEQSYCAKDGDFLYENKPDDTEEYYPTLEEQAKIIEAARIKRNWNQWEELENLWNNEDCLDCDDVTIATFLAKMMFEKRVIRVEPDQRKRINMMKTFKAYMMKSSDPKLFLAKDKISLIETINQVNEHFENS